MRCTERESGGVRCERHAGHPGPHACPEALARYGGQYGPRLPFAFCKDCGHQFTFERVRWGRNGYGWRCHCEGCAEMETFSDGSRSVHIRAGEGEGPWQALDDCAAMQWDCMPEELLEGNQ